MVNVAVNKEMQANLIFDLELVLDLVKLLLAPLGRSCKVVSGSHGKLSSIVTCSNGLAIYGSSLLHY